MELELPASFRKIKDQAGHWGFKATQIMAKKRVRILTFLFFAALTSWLLYGRIRIGEEKGNSVLPGVLDNPPQLAADKLNGIIVGGINRTRLTIPRFDQYGGLFLIPEAASNEASGGFETFGGSGGV